MGKTTDDEQNIYYRKGEYKIDLRAICSKERLISDYNYSRIFSLSRLEQETKTLKTTNVFMMMMMEEA